MLRDIIYSPHPQLVDILSRFNIERSAAIVVLRSEVISPDSFIWRLLIDGEVYYLYAEDYVPSIDHVRKVFERYTGNVDWELIEVANVFLFNEGTPVRKAAVYQRPKIAAEMMPYAADSGYDFVFLARSNEDGTKAMFSDETPSR